MTPVDLGLVLVVGVGRIHDQDIAGAHEIGELGDIAFVVRRRRRHIELVVGDVAKRLALVVDAVAEALAGVRQQHRLDLDVADLNAPLVQVAEQQMRGELANRDRKIDVVHLRRDQVAHCAVLVRWPQELEFVALDIERHEEGQRVDMIPVRMRDEDMRVEPALARRQDMVRQLLDAGTGVENEETALGQFECHARGIAAVAERPLAGHRQGAPDAPVGQRHLVRRQPLDLVDEAVLVDRLDDVAVGAELERRRWSNS